MYHFRFKGTHYESGFKYGSILKKNGIIIEGCPTFEITDDMKIFASQCLGIYKEFYPEIVQELKGIADAQCIDVNLLYQILFPMYCFKPEQHCTCFAINKNNSIILARNSDFLVSLEKLYLNCIYKLDNVYAFNGNTTAFVEIEDGMNEHGLAVGLTFLYPSIRKPGLNAGTILRYILEKCKDVNEAIRALQSIPIASAQTFTIADKFSNIVVIECNPQFIEVIYPKSGEHFVVTTNHFNSKKLQKYNAPKDIDTWQSEERYHTVQNALSKYKNNYDLNFYMDLLGGKYGFICQYDRKKNADTVWSVIYDVKQGKVYRVEGNPSRKKFKEDARMSYNFK